MSDIINNARVRMAQKRASDDELARLMGMTVEELDADTTAPDPGGTEEPTSDDYSELDWGGDPREMEPDYPALAAEEPTSQIEDCRDVAEVR